ncbi:transposase [Nostoc sp. CHAB 5834]|nr:transposase [Nostoc sp. CHAB 5834]
MALDLQEDRSFSYQYPPTLSRHKKTIRSYLQVSPFNQNALVDIINRYNAMPLTKFWGDGTTAAADGTKYDLFLGSKPL